MTLHLDDEALSAALDGEANPAETAHLSTCAHCLARLDQLAVVARAVGQPIAPRSSSAIDAAVIGAVRDWDRYAAEDRDPAPVGVAPVGVAPVGDEATSGPVTPIVAARAARAARERPVARWVLPAASVAAVVLILGGVAVLLGRSSPSTSTSALLAPATVPASGGTVAGRSETSSTAAHPLPSTAASDLGDQSDAAAVAQLVRPALQASESTAAAVNSAPWAPFGQQSVPCLAQARAASGLATATSGEPRYLAGLRWRGQSAEVVVFARPGGFSGLILKTGDCSVLAVLPL